jgi:signal transduction histidine kinase
MRRNISFTVIDSEIRKATWKILSLMALVFLLVVSFLLYQEHDRQTAHVREDFSEIVRSQQSAFAQEVYMNRREAIKMRVDGVLATWKEKHPGVQACLRMLFEPKSLRPEEFGGCSQGDSVDWSEPHGESIISDGTEPAARLQYMILGAPTWRDLFPPALLIAVLCAVFGAHVMHRVLMRRIQKTALLPLYDSMAESERNAAIAETTQMIAHDVKKPFQKLQFALQTIDLAKDPETIRQVSRQLLPGVGQSLESVAAMLRDIIDTGGTSLRKELMSPVSVIETALQDAFGLSSASDIKLSYHFDHKHKVQAEKEKILRVLVNIIENAGQAMGGKGKLTLSTRDLNDLGEDSVLFTIHNDGPAISKTDLDRIFNPFFTRKSDGNGLGLAIAERIILSHRGRIWCKSSKEAGTEFFFTLPASEIIDTHFPRLPRASSDFTFEVKILPETETKSLPPRVASQSGSVNEVPDILIFDDEQLIHDCWAMRAKLQDIKAIHHFLSWEDFVAKEGFDLVPNAVAFVDITFKNSRYNGAHIAHQLRRIGIKKLFAITGDPKSISDPKLFDAVFGKEIPSDIRKLIA